MRLLLGFCLFTYTCFAQHPFSIDAVMGAPFASSPAAAPHAPRVAWLLNERGVRNIWVAEAPDWKGHRLTAFDKDDGQEIAELAWSPDGNTLYFARGGDFENGGENPNPDLNPVRPDQSIWSVAFSGGAARKLTEGRAPTISPKGDLVAFLRGGQVFLMRPDGQNVLHAVSAKGTAEGLRWSPDGQRLAFTSNRRDHSFIGIYTPLDKSLRYLDGSTDHDSDAIWSTDGERLAYIRVPAEPRSFGPRRTAQPWSIRLFDLKSNSARQVFCANAGPGSAFRGLASDNQLFWTDDDQLVFPWERNGWLHLYSVPAAGGAARELTPGSGEVEHVSLSSDRKSVYYSANFKDIDRRHLWRVDVGASAVPVEITKGENIEWEPTPLGDHSGLVLLRSSYNRPAHAAVLQKSGEPQALAPESVPAIFPAASLVKPQPVMITAADGLEIHAQLFVPPGSRPGTRHPALIFFHGGSRRQMLLGFHYMYYYSNAYSLNQFFANQGYVVLSVNYRSGIGYGLNFREALNYGPSGASEYADVIGAGLYLKARPDVDGSKIGVWGGSYGGYLTALALARASDLFGAGVDFHGVHDWSTTRNFDFSGGDPVAAEQAKAASRQAYDSSPMAAVSGWRSPVMLIHGDDDRNVSFAQTVVLAAALRRQNVEFEELIFPNEIHDFLMHKHWVQAYTATADFFARHLRK